MRKIKKRFSPLALKKNSIFIYPFFFIGLLVLMNFLANHFFIVKTVVVEGEQILNLNFQNYGGKSLFFLNPKKIVQKIKEDDIKIKEAIVKKKFPDKILIEIETRQAIGFIVDKDNQFFFLDEEGVVFEKSLQTKSMPSLDFGISNPKVGQRLKSEFLIFALKTINELEKEKIKINKVKTDEFKETVIVEVDQGPKVYISKMKEPKEIATSLQLIINRFKIEGKILNKVDLRFAQPIISFGQDSTVSAEKLIIAR